MGRIIRLKINDGKAEELFRLIDDSTNFTLLEVKDFSVLPDKSVLFSVRDQAGNTVSFEQEKV